jgi:hypothetical protein
MGTSYAVSHRAWSDSRLSWLMCSDTRDSAIFRVRSVIWRYCQPFSGFTQPFGYSELGHFWYSGLSHFIYNEFSHFSYRAQSFYDFISHSAIVNLAIPLENSSILAIVKWVILVHWTHPFSTATVFSHSSCYIAQSFFVATLLSHFSLLIAQSIFITTVLNHFSLLQCSAIPHAKGDQSFIIATVSAISHRKKVLNHFSMLQYSSFFHYYSAQSLLVTTVAAQSFWKMTELDHGRARGWLTARFWVRAGVTRGSVAGVQDQTVRVGAQDRITLARRAWGAWFDRAGSVGPWLAGRSITLGDE